MKSATVTYCGVPLECQYHYEAGQSQTWTDPGYRASATAESIKVGGVEILDMLSNAQLEEIDALILQQHGEQDEIDAGEAYEMRRDERALEGWLS